MFISNLFWVWAFFGLGRTTLNLVSNETFEDHNICMKNSFLERKWRAGFSLKPMKKQVICLCLLLKQPTLMTVYWKSRTRLGISLMRVYNSTKSINQQATYKANLKNTCWRTASFSCLGYNSRANPPSLNLTTIKCFICFSSGKAINKISIHCFPKKEWG